MSIKTSDFSMLEVLNVLVILVIAGLLRIAPLTHVAHMVRLKLLLIGRFVPIDRLLDLNVVQGF